MQRQQRDWFAMSIASDIYIGPEVLTVAIPLGTLFLVMLWGFFQRRTNRR